MNCRIAKVLLGFCLLCAVRSSRIASNSSATDLIKGDTQPAISYNVVETDYYSDFDEEYERKTETIRTMENWIILGICAISLIGSLVIIVVLVHMKSRRASRLMHLM